MPVDVQPLSRTRRILMILVMLALLGVSLGFAKLLVNRRQASLAGQANSSGTRVRAIFPPPPGVSRFRVNTSAEEVMRGRYHIAQANWSGEARQFAAFAFPDKFNAGPWFHLSLLFSRLSGAGSDRILQPAIENLGGHRSLEAYYQGQDREGPFFFIMRLTAVEGDIVAFGFGGSGVFSDDDWRFFDDYCVYRVRIVSE